MQSLDLKMGENQSATSVPIPGITLSESWRSAFGKLSAGCLSDARAVILIGERGVGKASLVEAWRDQSVSAFHVVTLDEATGEPDQVVANLAHQMGVDTADLGRAAILSAISASVKSRKEAGKETVVIVDNADDVPSNTVELLMVLARDRGSNKPLLRYIFSGSSKLRKTLRLDGGAARRQNYVIVEMERFSQEQTKAFVSANLSRASDVTIAEDAAIYLHESTSGKPANILTVLDKVQSGRMAEGETEITKAHIQSLVKAPRPIGAAPKKPRSKSEVALSDGEDALSMGVSGGLAAAQTSGAAPVSGVGSSSELPDSIRDSSDPRPLLRWAFGLEGHSETDALAKRAEASAASRNGAPQRKSGNPEDLNAALAKVAAREQAERNPQPEAKAAPKAAEPSVVPSAEFEVPEEMRKPEQAAKQSDNLIAMKAPAENPLDHLIQGEAFSFEDSAPNELRAIRNPNELNTALREAPVAPPRRGNKLVFAAGVAVMGVAALGVLWTALQPSDIVNPLEGLDAPQQTAAVGAPKQAPAAPAAPTVDSASITIPAQNPALGDGEPDLAGVIALMKSPDVGGLDAAPQPFSDDTPRIVTAGYLAPSDTISSGENIGLRQAIGADMAASESTGPESTGIVGEERALTEQLTALQAQVSQAETLLNARREELAAVLLQQSEAKAALSDLQGELASAKTSQAEVEADLVQLRADKASQIAATEELSSDVSLANERLAAANSELEQATAALSERNLALEEITAQSQTAQSELEGLIAQLEAQKSVVTTSNQELADLASKRQNLEAELALKAAEVQRANNQLQSLEASQQTATNEFEELTARKAALQADLETGGVALENLTAELDTKKVAVDTLVNELNAGSDQITSQRAELSSLRTLAANVSADQSSAQATVTAEQNQVASAAGELDALKAQQVEMAAALSEIETLTAGSQRELDAIQADKAQAETEIAATVQRLEDIKAQEVAAEEGLSSFSGEYEAKQAELATLDGQISTSNEELEAVVTKTAALNSQLSELTSAGTAKLREQQSLLDQVTLELEKKQAALASLTQEIDEAEIDAPAVALAPSSDVEPTAELETVTVPAVRVRPVSSSSEPVATVELIETAPIETTSIETASIETTPIVETPQQQGGVGLSPRASDLVVAALKDAPGLGRAPQEKKDQLQAALIRGDCVTDALKETFGRVNPHTLVALLESMEMCGS